MNQIQRMRCFINITFASNVHEYNQIITNLQMKNNNAEGSQPEPLANSEPSDSIDLQPWNSGRAQRITKANFQRTCKHNKNSQIRNKSEIFCLSNRTLNKPSSRQKQHNAKVASSGAVHQKTKSFEHKLPLQESKVFEKPSTAPYNSHRRTYAGRKTLNKTHMSQELAKLGLVPTEEIVNDQFEDSLESINFYPQFRSSVQPRKNMLFLQPYMKSLRQPKNKYAPLAQNMNKMKTEIYKSIKKAGCSDAAMEECTFCKGRLPSRNGMNNSEELWAAGKGTNNPLPKGNLTEVQHPHPLCKCYLLSHRSVIEYLTEYEGDARNAPQTQQTVRSRQTRKHGSICVLREKLKNRFKDSKYMNNIGRVKYGQGIPVTIVQ